MGYEWQRGVLIHTEARGEVSASFCASPYLPPWRQDLSLNIELVCQLGWWSQDPDSLLFYPTLHDDAGLEAHTPITWAPESPAEMLMLKQQALLPTAPPLQPHEVSSYEILSVKNY